MGLRAKYLVTVVVLAASVVGAFAPGGRCLRSVFGAAQAASRPVLAAPDTGKVPGPLQVPACFLDAHNLIASVSESAVGPIHHGTVLLREAADRDRPVLPARAVPAVGDSPQAIPISRAPSVLRI
jgi:hypothetical protein